MLPVQKLDPEHCEQDQDDDRDKESKVGAEASVVVRFFRRFEELWADDVACAGADEKDACRYFALRVTSCVLA